MKLSEIMWWGYLHTSGSIHIKRYFDDGDLVEARQSPFVLRLVGPVKAASREDAEFILKNLLEGN